MPACNFGCSGENLIGMVMLVEVNRLKQFSDEYTTDLFCITKTSTISPKVGWPWFQPKRITDCMVYFMPLISADLTLHKMSKLIVMPTDT